jgi:hypothetical protein
MGLESFSKKYIYGVGIKYKLFLLGNADFFTYLHAIFYSIKDINRNSVGVSKKKTIIGVHKSYK